MTLSLQRRRFLAITAAATAGAAWFDIPNVLSRSALAADRNPWGSFPVGVQSYSLRNFKLPEAIRHLQGMGVHYVELAGTHLPTTASDEQIAETAKRANGSGLGLARIRSEAAMDIRHHSHGGRLCITACLLLPCAGES